ncbi:DsbC family protein [Methylophaga sp.]|jgi:thiol:disulfide interchange protein DsbC|uniref:DsbC family protein n=1 Tax=Methylophaga sp. TaxID=2024840 RepID=UPI00140142F0|nr:DsbC family protein [Methylophaga sp.]MTI64666.1 DsbC family protein [Methylophaga sp.]
MLKHLLLVVPLLLIGPVHADETDKLKKQLEKALPGVTVNNLKKVDNTQLYEGVINGEILYFSADARYVLQGELVSLESRTNLTEQRRVSLRKDIIDGLDEKDMIIFEPEKTEHTLTVFTDIDCVYCRKMHSEIEQYKDLGIRIRYMAYPRGGIDSESYDDAVTVWCNDDRQEAMTRAKAGEELKAKTCENPVKAEFETGQKLGVQGTPALFTESGQMLPGYVPPERLKEILEQTSGQS